MARPSGDANFIEVLGYDVAVDMYFPAGIPILALLALLAWNTWQEAERQRALGEPRSRAANS